MFTNVSLKRSIVLLKLISVHVSSRSEMYVLYVYMCIHTSYMMLYCVAANLFNIPQMRILIEILSNTNAPPHMSERCSTTSAALMEHQLEFVDPQL